MHLCDYKKVNWLARSDKVNNFKLYIYLMSAVILFWYFGIITVLMEKAQLLIFKISLGPLHIGETLGSHWVDTG